MSFKKLSVSLLITVCLCLFAACANPVTVSLSDDASDNVADIILNESEMFTERDRQTDYDESESISIILSDNLIQCSSSAVSVENNTVTISEAGTYVISGTLSDGQIRVEAGKNDKLQIVMDGASVNSSSSAALYVKQADKVFVTLKEGTQNVFSNSGNFVAVDTNNIDAAVYSKEDITFNGSGVLTVFTDYGHGIVSKDDLTVTGGSYFVNAAKHALCGKDCVKIAEGKFELTAGTDGIHSENADDATLGYTYIAGGSFNICAQSDGIDSAEFLQIANGVFKIECTGKGIKATGNITVADGAFDVSSTDDCVHSNSDVSIGGGVFTCSTSDDAFHADDLLTVGGGEITVTKSYEGLEGQNIVITSGTISVVSSDDGINAAGGADSSGFGGFTGGGPGGDRFNSGSSSSATITISGGLIYINAGGDGIDSNGNVIVSGGEIYVSGSTNSADAAIDFDGTATVTGGVVVAAGASGMAQNFGSNSTQGSILMNYSSQSKGAIGLCDGDGNILISYTPEKYYNSVLISCPSLKKGNSYTLTACGKTSSFTLSSLIYSNGTSGMGNQSGSGFGRP